jgi:hypothetical protein
MEQLLPETIWHAGIRIQGEGKLGLVQPQVPLALSPSSEFDVNVSFLNEVSITSFLCAKSVPLANVT